MIRIGTCRSRQRRATPQEATERRLRRPLPVLDIGADSPCIGVVFPHNRIGRIRCVSERILMYRASGVSKPRYTYRLASGRYTIDTRQIRTWYPATVSHFWWCYDTLTIQVAIRALIRADTVDDTCRYTCIAGRCRTLAQDVRDLCDCIVSDTMYPYVSVCVVCVSSAV